MIDAQVRIGFMINGIDRYQTVTIKVPAHASDRDVIMAALDHAADLDAFEVKIV